MAGKRKTLKPRNPVQSELSKMRASAMRVIRNAYDGATSGRRSSGWRSVSTDANAEALGSASRLRDVARDMCRNNPYAARAKAIIAHNTVGKGIIPSVLSQQKSTRDRLERLLKAHFDTVACDAAGRHDLYGIQNLVMQTIVESGECIVRLRPRLASDGLPLPFQIEVLEPDYLDSSKTGRTPAGGWMVQGVQYSPVAKLEGYWLFTSHPGSTADYVIPVSRFVPAEYVAHIFRTDRPGQARGVSWFAPVILRMRDFADFTDAQLMRQKIAACFAAFITGESDTSTITDDGGLYPVEGLEPGMISRLRDGEGIEFASPPSVGDFGPYATATLREIAVGLGISYEALTGDLSNVNFSSGRMGWLEFQRSIDAWRNHMLIPQFCHRVAGWFMDAAGVMAGRTADIQWTAPRREMVSPAQEVPAAIAAMRAGLSSRSEEQRKLGYDPADLDAEIAADNQRADDLGLVFDSDPRKVTSAGINAGLGDTTNQQ